MEIHKIAKSVIHGKTKMQELQRNGSWKPNKKEKINKILVRARSEGGQQGPMKSNPLDRSHTPMPHKCDIQLPPQRPRSAWNFSEEDEERLYTKYKGMDLSNDSGQVHSQLFYTSPPKLNMVRQHEMEKRMEGGSNTLTRLGKKFGYKEKVKVDAPKDSRQRSVSLDCGDGRKIKLFMSDNEEQPLLRIPHSASVPGRQSRSLSVIGNSSNGSSSQTPLTHKKKLSQSEIDLSPLSSKMFDKRKVEKDKRSIFDNQALFESVEQQDIDRVKMMLESPTHNIHINSLNSEGLTPLDIAIMTNNIPMAKLLLYHNARESPVFLRVSNRSERLDSLVVDAERRVVELSAAILNVPINGMSAGNQKDNEKKLSHWEFRHKLLKRMKAGYDHARVPDPPSYVSLTVSSSSSLLVKFDEPLNHNGAVVTKYKVEWSCVEDFVPLAGEDFVDNMRHLEYEITGLSKGIPYYVRVSACNMKGYSQKMMSKPMYAVPSCWRDIEGVPSCRLTGKHELLEEMFYQVKQLRPPDAAELKDVESPQFRKKKSIKNLFTSSPKFHKVLKRGLYLMALICYEDKLLVTADDQPPIVEVDESLTGSSTDYKDLQWLMKISCNWEDVKCFRHDMEKCTSAGVWHTRHKHLQAISLLQNSLGLTDLGQFYHRPLRDKSGNYLVLTTVCVVRDPKLVTLSSGRWTSVSRLQQWSAHGFTSDIVDSTEGVFGNIPEILSYNKCSSVPLSKGLYVAYLKLQVAVEAIQISVPRKSPSMLPNQKVRGYPNVSREEWEWLQHLHNSQSEASPTPMQAEFQSQILSASQKLFEQLGVSENYAKMHRFYDIEPIEVSKDVTVLLILPPAEDVCVVPGQADDIVSRRDLMLVPIKLFEMNHMSTYRKGLLGLYCRLSSLLEIDSNLAQQFAREAFSSEELKIAKQRVEGLSSRHKVLEDIWKSLRWIMDIITYARDKGQGRGLSLGKVMEGDLEAKPSPIFENNNSYHKPQATNCDTNHFSVGKDQRKIAKFYDPMQDSNHISAKNINGLSLVPTEDPTGTGSLAAGSANTNSLVYPVNTQSGVLQVYAAYDTGLSKSTRVRLHITLKTTAREVVNLVVRQLNKAIMMKGLSGPTYCEDQLEHFCLVSVIGARERILRDDYQPLTLQNPWANGKLYVRLRNNLLAAIQQGHATVV